MDGGIQNFIKEKKMLKQTNVRPACQLLKSKRCIGKTPLDKSTTKTFNVKARTFTHTFKSKAVVKQAC